MTILEMVAQYKKYIQEYVISHSTAHPHDVLQSLLEVYLKKYHVAASLDQYVDADYLATDNPSVKETAKISKTNARNKTGLFSGKLNNSTNVRFARDLMKAIYNHEDNIPHLMNQHLEKTPILKKDELFALLIAYFYYFELTYNVQDLKQNDALYKQILTPVRFYHERVESDVAKYLAGLGRKITSEQATILGQLVIQQKHIDLHLPFLNAQKKLKYPLPNQASTQAQPSEKDISLLLERLESKNPLVCKNAVMTLGAIAIPANQQELVINALLSELGKSMSYAVFEACYALGRIPIPATHIEAAINALLERINVHDITIQIIVCVSLGRIPIPEHLIKTVADNLIERLAAKDSSVRQIAAETLQKLPITDQQIDAVITDQLIKIKALSEIERIKACMRLTLMPIPDHQQKLVVQAILDFTKPLEIAAPFAYQALNKIPIPIDLHEKVFTYVVSILQEPLQEHWADGGYHYNSYYDSGAGHAELCEALTRVSSTPSMREQAMNILLDHTPKSSNAIISLYEKLTPNQQILVLVRLENKLDSLDNPAEKIPMIVLIQKCERKLAARAMLLSHDLPSELVEEINKKLR